MNPMSIEEVELLGDSKYRAYIAQVEKTLRNFETTSEWADLIAALGKLNKVLSAHVKYPVIPKRVTIGKRLAQCLHPALPSGVHIKALETYDIIFKCIGTPRLAADLFTYSAGLFPLLAHAAMNVRPALLSLYEAHFVPLGRNIKPALTGLLLGLLPGLDEGSESFERTTALLDEFCEASESTFFFTCMWECVLSSPAIRLPAINYVISRFNKKQTLEDQLYLMGTDIDLLVEALSVSVQDSTVLVQRSALELLLTAFPINNAQLTRPDKVKLVTAAVKVVLRRDMSLNRRLYGWLLGIDSAGQQIQVRSKETNAPERQLSHRSDTASICSEPENEYFHMFSKDLLVHAIKNCINNSHEEESIILSGRPSTLRPFRILISLLDRPEIGSLILEEILMDVFRYMYRECTLLSGVHQDSFSGPNQPTRMRKNREQRVKQEEKSITSEVVKTANLLFGTFEPYYIWDFIGRTFEKVCSGNGEGDVVSLTELCSLVDFLLDKVSLETYIETQTEYLPELLRTITSALTNACTKLPANEITLGLKLASKVLSRVLPSMTPAVNIDLDSSDPSAIASDRNHMNALTSQKSELSDYEKAWCDNEAGDHESGAVASSVVHLDVPNLSTRPDSPTDVFAPGETDSFQDFVQYEEHHASVKISPRRGKRDESVQEEPCFGIAGASTLMQACVHSFHKLFYTYVSSTILVDQEVVSLLLQQLMKTKRPHQVEDDFPQELQFVGVKSGSQTQTAGQEAAVHGGKPRKLLVDNVSGGLSEAFSEACQLLVDFSSFPMYCTNYHQVLMSSFREDVMFPDWLQQLITCACFVDNFAIANTAITTMLDLIALTQSVLEESHNKGTSEGDVGGEKRESVTQAEGTVSVVILPALSPSHLTLLNKYTNFYMMVANSLWGYLGESTPTCHARSVELLYNLHQLAPEPHLCEDVLGNALLSDDKMVQLHAYKRFIVLWHLLRGKRLAVPNPGKAIRTFERGPTLCFDGFVSRSMFLLLDSLHSDSHPCSSLSQTWLQHAVQRGDIARILEPILLILLHPDTARISIQHVNIQQPQNVRLVSESSDDSIDLSSEARVYAISSEGGNVIYHVNKTNHKTPRPRTEERRTFVLTTITESDKKDGTGNKTAKTEMETEFFFDKVNPTDVNVQVNPFGKTSSHDRVEFEGYEAPPPSRFPDMKNVKRLDAETCRKEGIYFVDAEEGVDALDERDLTMEVREETDVANEAFQEGLSAEEIAAAILEEIINTVVAEKQTEESLSTIDSKESSLMTTVTQQGSLVELEKSDSTYDHVEQKVSDVDSLSDSDAEVARSAHQQEQPTSVHPLHNHILLYGQKYDSQRTLFALNCIKVIITTYPRIVSSALTTTNISSSETTVHHVQILSLLIRHRRSIFGKNFFSEFPADALSTFHSTMYIEVLISLCLYFIRSYYPNLMLGRLSDLELASNKEVQIVSCELLTLLMSQLASLVQDSGQGFSKYINDLLAKCKLQKVVLHCLLASVYNARCKSQPEGPTRNLTEAIISFNEDNTSAEANEGFQVKLLKLISVIIVLEEHISHAQSEADMPLPSDWDRVQIMSWQSSLLNSHYVASRRVVYQSILLSAILAALKQQHLSHMHRHWITLLTSALPYLSRATSHVVVNVVSQLCRNIELLSQQYQLGAAYRSGSGYQPDRVPPDHMLTLLEGLTTLCHYCLLDSQQLQGFSVGQTVPQSPAVSGSGVEVSGGGVGPDKRIFSNIIHAFNPSSNAREGSPSNECQSAANPVSQARRQLLTILPRILSALAVLWKAVHASESKQTRNSQDQPCWTMGVPSVVRKFILAFISPVCIYHAGNLMAAIAVVWNDRRQRGNTSNKRPTVWPRKALQENCHTPPGVFLVMALACEEQQLLVDLVGAVKVLPTDTLINTVKQVIKSPPSTRSINNKRTPLEVSLLQFFFAYIQRTPGVQLVDSWPALLALLKDALQISLIPPAQFLLLGILNEFVQKIPMFEDRKDLKDLQEITQKLLEATGDIAGSCLEQTTFFRRNMAVKPGPQIDVTAEVEEVTTDQETEDLTAEVAPESAIQSGSAPRQPRDPEQSFAQYSVQALVILAELTATLLDVVYRSEEKDRVGPLLNNLMYNVFPYLRNHCAHNLPSFRACSQMLASLSSYSYTRKAWKREAFELLLDGGFFQMDDTCIGLWRVIIDNLMSHDKVTFKDLLSRVTLTQGASLNLFSSREQEVELRAQLLKRLSYTVFCSDVDQYQRSMPEIQERMSDSLRLTSVPSIQAQVLLCFRVLIMRVSPQHLTSLWPTIITEMVHILLQIEQELTPDVEDNRSKMAQIANLDPSWALGNGISSNQPSYLRLYLAACKLLDLALILPADALPQFQLYRWAFVGDPSISRETGRRFKDQVPFFTPHINRIAKLMNLKYTKENEAGPLLQRIPGRPLLKVQHIRSVRDLHPFFNTIATFADSTYKPAGCVPVSRSNSMPADISALEEGVTVLNSHRDGKIRSVRQYVEEMLEADFLEPLPRS